MSDKKLWEQYVALEKERDTLRSDLAEFQYAAAVANDTIKALQAKVEQMERQEPECEVVGQVRNVLYEVRTLKYDLPAGTKLYALPGAHPTPSEEARLVSYCPDGNTCTLNINGVEMYYDRVDRDASSAPSVSDDWRQHAARMAALARKLREPDWHFESIREMQRELCALEDAALAAAPEARQ